MSRRQKAEPQPCVDGEDLSKKRRFSFDLEPSLPSHERAIDFLESLPHGYMKKFVVAVAMSFDHLHPKEIKKMLDRLSDVNPLPLPALPLDSIDCGVSARVGASVDASTELQSHKPKEEQKSKQEVQQPVRKKIVSGRLSKDG